MLLRPGERSLFGEAIAAAADLRCPFKSRKSREGAAVSLIFLGESGGFETGGRRAERGEFEFADDFVNGQ
jgi:hypothetical protein